MTFDEILEQVISLLKRQERVSYRALKRRFDLDDDFIEDLKEELIQALHVAVDEDDRVLAWTGEAGATPGASSPSTKPAQSVVTQEAQPTPVEPPPTETPTPDAERRQLTVMFCDLADSTKLSGQLDPEDLRDVIRAYQSTSADVIERYDGHIAQYLGDGLLVYFGWPQAHEDDAQRSIHAGLGLIEDMGDLNTHLQKNKGIRLAVRIGIHTGPVVIGEMGGGGRHEQLALGETTNIASRLEGMAQPNTVVVSETTYRLVEGYFSCDGLGTHTLKGVATPMQTYQVREATGVHGRLDAAMSRGLTPLVGREQETGLLLERWAQVKEGQGQVILLNGEAGIGKSRLVQVLKDHVAEGPHIRLECRSSPYYQNTALYPITDIIQRTLRWEQDDTPAEKLVKLEQMLDQYKLPLEETVPLFATLLSLPIPEDRYPPLQWTPQRQRQKTLEALVAMVLEQAEQRPVFFILEDLHWTDPTTLELLGLLIDQTSTASIFTFLTCRPTFQAPWSSRSYLTQVTLNRLSRSQIEYMAERVADGKKLPAEVMQQLVEKTDGVPLYVEEMTKAILESGVLQATNGHYELTGPLSSLSIPATLQDSLMARLDRLGTAKGIAQLGATLGRTFTYKFLQAVSSLDERVISQSLVELVEAELLYQRGSLPHATFTFKHALIQETAYQSLLRNTRQRYHQQIAQMLELRFPETVETQPELVAYHYTVAGLSTQAVDYWNRAGQQAVDLSAYVEASHYLHQGLDVITLLPDTPERRQSELALLMALATALIASSGHTAPETERVLSRAYTLCQQVGERPHLFEVLNHLWGCYVMRGELHTAQEIADQLLRVAQRQHNSALCLAAHHALGSSLYHRGAFGVARTHLEQGIALYDPCQHVNPRVTHGTHNYGVSCCGLAALTLWVLGYRNQAHTQMHEALTMARTLAHSHSLAYALWFAIIVHCNNREIMAVQDRAEELLALSDEYGFAIYLRAARFWRDWSLAMQRQENIRLSSMRQSLEALQTTGTKLTQTTELGRGAEAYGESGHPEEGLILLAEAVAVMDNTEARFYGAELYRLKGILLLKQTLPDASQAETCFQQALDIARRQEAKSWELRAATSLARLWQTQGKRQDAYDLLAPVYNWFTEGFDTADLQDAKALLDELG